MICLRYHELWSSSFQVQSLWNGILPKFIQSDCPNAATQIWKSLVFMLQEGPTLKEFLLGTLIQAMESNDEEHLQSE